MTTCNSNGTRCYGAVPQLLWCHTHFCLFQLKQYITIFSHFLLLFQTNLSLSDRLPVLPPYSPHFYRSPLSLIPSVEPYWEGLDASRYRPQPSSPQWVCHRLSPRSCTLYRPLCTLVRPKLLRLLTLLHASGQMSPRQQQYWLWSTIDEWWGIFIVRSSGLTIREFFKVHIIHLVVWDKIQRHREEWQNRSVDFSHFKTYHFSGQRE